MFIHNIHRALILGCLKATPTSLLKSYLDTSGDLEAFNETVKRFSDETARTLKYNIQIQLDVNQIKLNRIHLP